MKGIKNKIIAGAIGLAALIGTAQAAEPNCQVAQRSKICTLEDRHLKITAYKISITPENICGVKIVTDTHSHYIIYESTGCKQVTTYINGLGVISEAKRRDQLPEGARNLVDKAYSRYIKILEEKIGGQ